jgi:hypothetical protein
MAVIVFECVIRKLLPWKVAFIPVGFLSKWRAKLIKQKISLIQCIKLVDRIMQRILDARREGNAQKFYGY